MCCSSCARIGAVCAVAQTSAIGYDIGAAARAFDGFLSRNAAIFGFVAGDLRGLVPSTYDLEAVPYGGNNSCEHENFSDAESEHGVVLEAVGSPGQAAL